MIHPLELQRSNMIAYEQIDNEGNHIIIDGKSQMPDYLSEGMRKDMHPDLKPFIL